MKKASLILLLFLLLGALFPIKAQFSSQELAQIDSLNQIIQEARHDTSLAKAYVELSEIFHVSNLDTLIPLCKKAKSIAETNLIRNDLPAQEKRVFQVVLAQALNNLGVVYDRRGDISLGLEYYQKALEIQEAIGDKHGMANSLNNIGLVFKKRGDIPRALDHYFRSLKLWEELGSKNGKSYALNNLGVIYQRQKDIPKALEYYQQALEIREEIGNKIGIGESLNNIGFIYDLKEDYPRALEYYFQSLKIKEEIGHKMGIANALTNIGSVYLKQGDLEKALENYQRSLQIRQESGDLYGIANSLNNIASIYEERGDYSTAINYGKEALAIAQQVGTLYEIRYASSLLYSVYYSTGQYQDALRMHELTVLMNDSLLNEKNTREAIIQEMNYKYEQQEQERLLAQAEKEHEEALRQQKKNLLTYGSFSLIVLLGLIAFVMLRSRHRKKELLRQQKLKEKQQHVEKLKELDQAKTKLYTNITHEFRTPLTVIQGLTDQIESEALAKNEKHIQANARIVKRNSLQLLALVNQMLDLRKLESGKLPINMVQGDVLIYLKYLLESFHSLAEAKDIRPHFLCEEKELVMDYDPEKLRHIVSNLLSNAIKFTEKGGDVYLMVKSEGVKSEGNTSPLTAHSSLCIQVKDTGMGIPGEKIPYIFDRFYQVEDDLTRKAGGTGIGLTLTKELVKLLRGEIQVESEIGKGATFSVWLPIQRKAQSIKGIPPALMQPIEIPQIEDELVQFAIRKPPSDSSERPLVLIIEDNKDVAYYIHSCLEADYELLTAADGQQGIDIAIENVPDIIISDVMMPEKDGLEVCEILKEDERTSHVPIVLLTAKADMESRLAGLKRGADAYLSKPFNKEELFIRLEKLLELRRELQARYSSLDPRPLSAHTHFEDVFLKKSPAAYRRKYL